MLGWLSGCYYMVARVFHWCMTSKDLEYSTWVVIRTNLMLLMQHYGAFISFFKFHSLCSLSLYRKGLSFNVSQSKNHVGLKQHAYNDSIFIYGRTIPHTWDARVCVSWGSACVCEQLGGCAGWARCHQARVGADCEARGPETGRAGSHPVRYHWPIASESDVGICRPHAAETSKRGSPWKALL